MDAVSDLSVSVTPAGTSGRRGWLCRLDLLGSTAASTRSSSLLWDPLAGLHRQTQVLLRRPIRHLFLPLRWTPHLAAFSAQCLHAPRTQPRHETSLEAIPQEYMDAHGLSACSECGLLVSKRFNGVHPRCRTAARGAVLAADTAAGAPAIAARSAWAQCSMSRERACKGLPGRSGPRRWGCHTS